MIWPGSTVMTTPGDTRYRLRGGQAFEPIVNSASRNRDHHDSRCTTLPGVDASAVPIGERRLHCVVADGFEVRDLHVALADLQHLLAGSMTAHFGGRRIHAQQFVAQLE